MRAARTGQLSLAGQLWLGAEGLYTANAGNIVDHTTESGVCGFGGGNKWMAQVLRGWGIPADASTLHPWGLGVLKYSICSLTAITVGSLFWPHYPWMASWSFFALFYFTESWMIFLFPCMLAQQGNFWLNSLALTMQAGGPFRASRTVMHLAFKMTVGALLGRSLLKSWYLGCASVLLWYVSLRVRHDVNFDPRRLDKWLNAAIMQPELQMAL